MSVGQPLTIEDYERLPQSIVDHTDLVDGELVDVSGNTPAHNWLRDCLVCLLRPFTGRNLGMVISEQGFDFGGNVYGPDVSFFRAQKVPLVAWRKRVQPFVPDLAVEIASSSVNYDA